MNIIFILCICQQGGGGIIYNKIDNEAYLEIDVWLGDETIKDANNFKIDKSFQTVKNDLLKQGVWNSDRFRRKQT